MGVQTLPTGIFGPLFPGTRELLLGKSSIIIKGLEIYPGVIDNDYAEEVRVMVASPHGIITVPGELLNLF
jgi:dUTPase